MGGPHSHLIPTDHPQPSGSPIPLPAVSCTSCPEHKAFSGGDWCDPTWGRSPGGSFPQCCGGLVPRCSTARSRCNHPPPFCRRQGPGGEKPPALTLEVGYFGDWAQRSGPQHLGLNLLLSDLLFFPLAGTPRAQQALSSHLHAADGREVERFISEEGKAASARPIGQMRVFGSLYLCSLAGRTASKKSRLRYKVEGFHLAYPLPRRVEIGFMGAYVSGW